VYAFLEHFEKVPEYWDLPLFQICNIPNQYKNPEVLRNLPLFQICNIPLQTGLQIELTCFIQALTHTDPHSARLENVEKLCIQKFGSLRSGILQL
jgi:hypothetical protein